MKQTLQQLTALKWNYEKKHVQLYLMACLIMQIYKKRIEQLNNPRQCFWYLIVLERQIFSDKL